MTMRYNPPGTTGFAVGGGLGVSTAQVANLTFGVFDDQASDGIVHSNGVIEITGANLRVYANTSRAGTLSLEPGSLVEMCTNAVLKVDNYGSTRIAVLMGVGTISRSQAGPNFAIVNDGIIRSGDTPTGSLIGTGSIGSTPAIGTLTVNGGNLTNTANGTLYFDFDATKNDQIAISGGTATIGGTVTFTNMAGFRPAKKTGKKWDFVRAAGITYTATDNMSALMTVIGLTVGDDYTFGVVTDGAVQALRLKMNGPSGTIFFVH